jgi:WD40 repeat protein/tetratricopeptide (TPR) repeat protein
MGGPTGTVEVWDVFTGAPTGAPDRPIIATQQLFRADHGGQVSSVCFSPDGRRVLSASYDETARVWEARKGAPLLELRHESSVFRAAYSPDGRWIISGGRDQTARVWSVTTGRPAVAPLSHSGTVAHVRFDPTGERVLTTAADGARLWHLRTGEPVSPILKLSEPVWKMTVSADGTRAAAIGRRGAVGAWDAQTGKGSGGRLPFHEANGVYFSADASQALIAARPSVASTQEIARLYRIAPGVELGATLALKGPVTCALFSPDGSRVFVACRPGEGGEGTSGLWEIATGKMIGAPFAITGTVGYAAFSPDGRCLLTAGGTSSPVRGEARIWDAATGEAITPPVLHDEAITHASFNHDLTLLITASVDDSAKIWALDFAQKTAQPKHLLAEHSADLGHASFSPDGKHAVTASYDRTAMLWSLEDGRRISMLQHPGWINDAQFSADGRFLVTACSDQMARVWEVATGDLVALFRHAGEVTRAFFSPAGDVVTLSLHSSAPLLRDARTGVEAASDPSSRGTMLKVQTWRLARATESVGDLADFAKILRSRRIENERDLVRLQREEFVTLWKKHPELIAKFAADVPPALPLLAVDDSEATGEWFAAHWHLSRLLAAQPDDPALLVRRGWTATNLRQWPEAVADFERAVALKPDAPTFSRLTRADLELNRFPEAVQHATQGLALGEDRDLLLMRAEGYAAQEHWENAAADLTKAIDLQPRLAAAYERLAAVRLKQNQIEAYREVVARLVQNALKDDSIAGTAAWACALHKSALPDPQVAVALAELTLAQQPTPYYDLNTLGAALYRAGKSEEARKRLQESRAAYVQAASLAHAQGLPAAAIMPIRDGRPIDWIFLAMIHEKLGHRSEAEDWLQRAAAAVTDRSITDPRRIWHRIEVELLLEEARGLLSRPPTAR